MNPAEYAGQEFELTSTDFETALDFVLKDKEFAGEIEDSLRAARRRLQEQPGLLVGGEVGEFTYRDPVLEQAVYATRLLLLSEPKLLRAGAKPGEKLVNRPRAFGRWLVASLRAFKYRHDASLLELAQRVPTAPVVFNGPTTRLAIVGDAGFQGIPQEKVLQMILKVHRAKPFDALIHLGDIYLAGDVRETVMNFVKPFSKVRDAGARVFSLLGNHDLYCGAEGYEHVLSVFEQPGRYFAIQTPSWRIACLDTSLADGTLGRLQGRLDPTQLEWLRTLVSENEDRRNLVMSHHYYISAWNQSGESLRDQVHELMKDNIFAWYWGHEHGCATYDRTKHGFYGACIGNGAFREPWSKPINTSAGFPSWYAEGRCKCFSDDQKYWPHGFLELELFPDSIKEIYHLEDGPDRNHEQTLSLG